ncbi:hypothetical protein EOM89_12220 [Candidatus Falkowbacteria bacterium]|nr:hypothetical protein [Candidatus Falkowbacteria bacterium]
MKLNTRGVAADRPAAAAALKNYFTKHLGVLCDDCKKRLEGNVWRILDCKQPACREVIAGVPDYAGMFSAESRAYFEEVCRRLDWLGIRYEIDPFLVRGLDYYVHTVFELTHAGLGAQNAVAGGGRYELLLPGETKPVVGVGFAAGMERLLMARESLGLPAAPEIPQRDGLRWRHALKDLASALFYRLRSGFLLPPPEIDTLGPARQRVWAVFAPDDPLPALGELGSFLAKALKRLAKFSDRGAG